MHVARANGREEPTRSVQAPMREAQETTPVASSRMPVECQRASKGSVVVSSRDRVVNRASRRRASRMLVGCSWASRRRVASWGWKDRVVNTDSRGSRARAVSKASRVKAVSRDKAGNKARPVSRARAGSKAKVVDRAARADRTREAERRTAAAVRGTRPERRSSAAAAAIVARAAADR